MQKVKAALIRLQSDNAQTLGLFQVYSPTAFVFQGVSLELPHKSNERNISRIPAARYKVEKYVSPTFGECLRLKDVPGRTAILVHAGNYKKDTRGCILVGKNTIDIDGDGHLDVTHSKDTLKSLLNVVPDELFLDVIDMDY